MNRLNSIEISNENVHVRLDALKYAGVQFHHRHPMCPSSRIVSPISYEIFEALERTGETSREI